MNKSLPSHDFFLFREEVSDCRLLQTDYVPPFREKPKPYPQQATRDEAKVMQDALSDEAFEHLDCEDASYLQDSVPANVLKKIYRGHWAIEAKLDLHGMNRDMARASVNRFIGECVHLKKRCVRIIHGKGLGSEYGVPVLKRLVPVWLKQKKEVLAFTTARPADGGDGALLVLLKG
jgi:DNA-nicking Smr family endonuclease